MTATREWIQAQLELAARTPWSSSDEDEARVSVALLSAALEVAIEALESHKHSGSADGCPVCAALARIESLVKP